MERQLDELVFDNFIVGHDHQNEASGTGHDDVEPLNCGGIGCGGHGHGGQIGHFGDHLAHLGDDLIHFLHFQFQRLVQTLGLIHAQPIILHQLIHIQPVAGRGGDASGRGVGLLQQAHLGQVRHLVADGGGTAVNAGHGGQSLGADRLSGLDIMIHDGAEDFFLSLRQFHGKSPLMF